VTLLAAPRRQVQPERGVRAADRQPLTGPHGGKRPRDQQVTALVKAKPAEVDDPAEVTAAAEVGAANCGHGGAAYGR
jgi:hypothetical protein